MLHGDNGGTLTVDAPGSDVREYSTPYITRVEGEGSLSLTVKDGEVTEARLKIFEAPRYFERLVVGRTGDEVLDIVARICGICPIAYQMSAVHAFEDLYGVRIDPQVRALRRLLYCGEWIQSHALHVYMLHAPDFLGYPSALAMAADHRALVEQGLAIKKVGNELIKALGGRPVHPVSVRVGGFSRAPRMADLEAVRRALDTAVEQAKATVRLVATWTPPELANPQPLVALRHPGEYPYNEGRIVSTDGLDIATQAWGDRFEELHVEGTNALHARTHDGQVYLLGPTARIALAAQGLHPLAFEELAATGLREAIRVNIHRSIVARAVELLHALAEARDIIDGYRPPSEPRVPFTPRPGIAAWSTEAPRGLLHHRYEVD
ncbi:MAG TPA: nickel-dependent hydrogenase large subunit, partial [Candidatus Limnocylindrales bacterium]|nr:nickel-dependent hydrogenase large subunit [Candidatus Limnocylindrales bacterium]